MMKAFKNDILERILRGNHQFARAQVIAVCQGADAAIYGFYVILLVEDIAKLC